MKLRTAHCSAARDAGASSTSTATLCVSIVNWSPQTQEPKLAD
jgi:hypothetical protein